VASHVFGSPASGHPGRLYRYSYDTSTDRYTRDAGFPVTINNFRTETLVVDKDSTGQLWATWVQGGKVWVTHSVCAPACDDTRWAAPFVPAVNGVHPGSTDVTSDDISSLVAFAGRVGLMWSNQSRDAVF